MPAPLCIILTAEQEYTLSELRQAQNVPQRTREREYDVAIGVMHGIKARSEASEYTLKHFIFNCT